VKDARLSLAFGAALVLATTPLFGQALGYQITTDHVGFISMPGFKPPLQMKWSVNFPGIASYPIVVGGKVFVADQGTASVPSTLHALDATTGEILWTQPVPPGFGLWIGFAYENGGLFGVTTENPNFGSGAIFAFSAKDGHQVWSANLPGQYSFSSAPTARNGLVYTSGAGGGGTVYAVKEINGQVTWTANVENGESSPPAVTDSGVYVSYVCPQTYRFDPKTGQQIWHFSGNCEGGGGESAAVYGGLVFVRDVLDNYPTDGIALNASNGSFLGGANSKYSPAFALDDAVLTEPTTLTAVKITSGHTLWTAIASAGENYSCSPIIVNDVVYVGTSAGNLEGYSGETGAQVYSVNLGQAISCNEFSEQPLVGMSAGEGLLVVPAGNTLVALQ
jgi:outer membrane protein assembly factor BamB